MVSLVLRQHIGQGLVDAELPGYRIGGSPGIAREHDDAHAEPAQSCNRFGRAFLDGVCDRGNAGGHSTHSKVHHRFCLRAPSISLLFPVPRIDALLSKKVAAAHQHAPAVDLCLHAQAVQRIENPARPRA